MVAASSSSKKSSIAVAGIQCQCHIYFLEEETGETQPPMWYVTFWCSLEEEEEAERWNSYSESDAAYGFFYLFNWNPQLIKQIISWKMNLLELNIVKVDCFDDNREKKR